MKLGLGIGLGLSLGNRLRNIGSVFQQLGALLHYDNELNEDIGVSQWTDLSSNNHHLEQSAGAQQPAYDSANGEIDFDGSNDHLNVNFNYDLGLVVSAVQDLPDAQGGDAGEGFTCTGIVLDPQDDTFWISNDGRGNAPTDTHECSLVNVSKNGATKLAELDMQTVIGQTSLQGIAYDTSNNSLWVSANNARAHNINKTTGAQLSEFNYASDGGASALSYDSNNNNLLITGLDGTIRRYSKTGSLIESIVSGVSNVDQSFYDASNNILWLTSGSNNSEGAIYPFNLNTETLGQEYYMTGVDAIEGVYIDIPSNQIYMTSDGYFHDTASAKNRLLRYDFNYGQLLNEIKPGFDVYARLKVNAISGTDAIFSFDDPLGADGIAVFITSATNARIIYRDDGAGSAVENVTIDNITTQEELWRFAYDINTGTFSVYKNGELQGSAVNNSVIPSYSFSQFMLGDVPESGRELNMSISKLAVFDRVLTDAEAAQIEATI